MSCRNLSKAASISSTATGPSILSKTTILTNVTSVNSIASHVSMSKGLAAPVNAPSQNLTVINPNNPSLSSTPEPITPTTDIRGAISRHTAARHLHKTQKAAIKAIRKEENRARSRAYFADFYADDKVGAWHNAPASGICSCGCNDTNIEDPVPTAELIGMQTQPQASPMGVTRMVDGRAVKINF